MALAFSTQNRRKPSIYDEAQSILGPFPRPLLGLCLLASLATAHSQRVFKELPIF